MVVDCLWLGSKPVVGHWVSCKHHGIVIGKHTKRSVHSCDTDTAVRINLRSCAFQRPAEGPGRPLTTGSHYASPRPPPRMPVGRTDIDDWEDVPIEGNKAGGGGPAFSTEQLSQHLQAAAAGETPPSSSGTAKRCILGIVVGLGFVAFVRPPPFAALPPSVTALPPSSTAFHRGFAAGCRRGGRHAHLRRQEGGLAREVRHDQGHLMHRVAQFTNNPR